MKDIEFTPLMQYLAKQQVDSAVNWVPGVGWVNAALGTAQWSVDVASKVRDVYRVGKVAAEVAGIEETSIAKGVQYVVDLAPESVREKVGAAADVLSTQASLGLDVLVDHRVKTVTDAVKDLIKTEKVNLNVVVLQTLRDKLVYGWDNSRVAYEIGKRVLVGQRVGDIVEADVGIAAGVADSVAREIGGLVWQAFDYNTSGGADIKLT